MNKREFIKSGIALGAASVLPISAMAMGKANIHGLNDSINEKGEYTLPKLPYPYNSLEPYMDEQTMKLHHDIHHLGYVNGLNTATSKVKEATEKGDFAIIKHWQRELAFHGAGHFLHTIFWNVMSAKQGSRSKELDNYINKSFGSFDSFKKYYKAASVSVEGSGWGILSYEPYADKLVVLQAERHSDLTQWVSVPLLPVDVWEHAYYLKYQNKRGDYVDAFMNVVNWDYVSEQFDKILKMYK